MSKRKVRPCKEGCGYPAAYGRQRCIWHALMRLSSQEQADAAEARLSAIMLDPDHVFRARVPQSEWPAGERWCSGCQDFVPLFYCSGSRCRAHASIATHASRVEKVYGISAEDYAGLLQRQGGRCAICRSKSRSIRLAVDHNHQTGEVRGLLCKRCNHDLLGSGYDSPAKLWDAIRYLINPPMVSQGRVMGDVEVFKILEQYLGLNNPGPRGQERMTLPPEQDLPPF